MTVKLPDVPMITKHCPRCDRTLPVDRFWRNRSLPDGLACWCKPCSMADKARAAARLHANRFMNALQMSPNPMTWSRYAPDAVMADAAARIDYQIRRLERFKAIASAVPQ